MSVHPVCQVRVAGGRVKVTHDEEMISFLGPLVQQFTNIFQELGPWVWVFVALESESITLSHVGGIRSGGGALLLTHSVEDKEGDDGVVFAIQQHVAITAHSVRDTLNDSSALRTLHRQSCSAREASLFF